MIASVATIISSEPADRARPRPVRRTGCAATATPETASSGPSARRGGITSATRPPAQRAQGDGRQRDADDQRARLQGETEVGRQQPQRDHLDHQHAGRCAEDQCRRGVPAQLRRVRMCDDNLARFAAHRWIMPRVKQREQSPLRMRIDIAVPTRLAKLLDGNIAYRAY